MLKKLLLLVGVCVLSACAALTEHTFTVSESQLQQKLSDKLAKTPAISLLKIFDVVLTNPSIKLDPATERINTGMDALVSNPLFGKPMSGRANISGKLRFDAATQSVLLTEPKVESINIDTLNPRYNELITALAGRLGGDFLNDLPLYTLKPDDLKVAGITFNPKAIKVGAQGLMITLAPK